MKKLLFTLTLAGALALGGQSAFAQAKKKTPAAEPAPAAEKSKAADTGKPKTDGDTAKPKADGDAAKPKRDTIPYFGDVAAVDSTAKTITLKAKDPTKGRVFKVTDATKIVKVTGETEAPATLADVKADAYITGIYKKSADGSLEVLKVTLGKTKAAKAPKAEGEAKKPAEAPKKK